MTFGIGPAGTGKTYLAMAMALAALQEEKVARIILTRPAVEAGEALGFLPGDLYEKITPYLRPLTMPCTTCCRPRKLKSTWSGASLKSRRWPTCAGALLNNAFIILDEAQNSTTEQMFMFLTRLGIELQGGHHRRHRRKSICRGHKHSGLLEAEHALQGVEGIALVEFSRRDVVRHPLVQRIIAAYEEHRGRQQ